MHLNSNANANWQPDQPPNYRLCQETLEEDSDEIHPHIEERTFRGWMRQRKDAVRETLAARKGFLQAAAEAGELSANEEAELAQIDRLLQERIIQVVSETSIAQPAALHLVVSEPPAPLAGRVDEILQLLLNSDSTAAYLEDVLAHRYEPSEHAEELELHLLSLISLNAAEKNSAITRRLCRYAIAQEHLLNRPANEVTPALVQAVTVEGELYFQRIVSHFTNKS